MGASTFFSVFGTGIQITPCMTTISNPSAEIAVPMCLQWLFSAVNKVLKGKQEQLLHRDC